jgi:hypothetical protein
MTTFLSRLEVMVRSIPLRVTQTIRRRQLMELYLVGEFPRAMKFEDIVEKVEDKDAEKAVCAVDRLIDHWEVAKSASMRVPKSKPTFGGWFYATEAQAIEKAKERASVNPTMKLVLFKMTSLFELGTVQEVKVETE